MFLVILSFVTVSEGFTVFMLHKEFYFGDLTDLHHVMLYVKYQTNSLLKLSLFHRLNREHVL